MALCIYSQIHWYGGCYTTVRRPYVSKPLACHHCPNWWQLKSSSELITARLWGEKLIEIKLLYLQKRHRLQCHQRKLFYFSRNKTVTVLRTTMCPIEIGYSLEAIVLIPILVHLVCLCQRKKSSWKIEIHEYLIESMLIIAHFGLWIVWRFCCGFCLKVLLLQVMRGTFDRPHVDVLKWKSEI